MSDLQHIVELLHTPSRSPPRLDGLHAEIARARRELEEAWASTSSVDRIFAVDRVLHDGGLPQDAAQRLAEVQARVRDAWVDARVAGLAGPDSTAARLAGLRLTLVEREVDAFLADHGAFDALFFAAEGFLRRVPAPRGHTFRELMRAKESARARLVPILPALEI